MTTAPAAPADATLEADILDYTEKTVAETLSILRKSYDDLHERLQKFITALVGGAAAVG